MSGSWRGQGGLNHLDEFGEGSGCGASQVEALKQQIGLVGYREDAFDALSLDGAS